MFDVSTEWLKKAHFSIRDFVIDFDRRPQRDRPPDSGNPFVYHFWMGSVVFIHFGALFILFDFHG